MQRSKAYRQAESTFDKNELYSPLAAIKIAKGSSKKKFDETVDVVMRLGVDPRKADQMVRGTVNLPHGTGKTARVLVFANAEKADAAREAGADVVGGDELMRSRWLGASLPRADVTDAPVFADVTGAGHMVAGDQNDTFTAAVLTFLSEVRTGTTRR